MIPSPIQLVDLHSELDFLKRGFNVQDYEPTSSSNSSTANYQEYLQKPLLKNWKREVVRRSNSNILDVYYIGPDDPVYRVRSFTSLMTYCT